MSRTADTAAVDWHDGIATAFNEGYRRSPAFIERERVWRRLIADHVTEGGDVLDAGCGSGVFSFIAAERARSVTAIDGSANMIALARAEAAKRGLGNVTFETAMLSALAGHADARYDAILSSSVLEYVEGFDTVLADFARLLRPGGVLIVSMPNAHALYRKAERIAFGLTGKPRYYAHVRNVITPESLSALLRANRLSPQETRYFADAPVAGQALSAVLPHHRAKSLFAIAAVKAS